VSTGDFSLISGASKGIGSVIAEYLHNQTEDELVLLARNFSDSKKKSKKEVHEICVDLTNESEIFDMKIPESCKDLKALVLNAGTFYTNGILDSGEKEIQKQFELNVFSYVNIIQKMLPYFVDGKTHIFIMASSASYSGIANAGMYAASKHAVLGLARSLRAELSARKIKVTALAPGSTWSSSWEGSGVDPNTLIDPKDIAHIVYSLMNTSFRTNVDEVILNPL